jgi:hypothetical protein
MFPSLDTATDIISANEHHQLISNCIQTKTAIRKRKDSLAWVLLEGLESH